MLTLVAAVRTSRMEVMTEYEWQLHPQAEALVDRLSLIHI